MNGNTLRFIREHAADDVHTLALHGGRYPDVDMSAALTQIAGRQSAAQKIPSWVACEGLLYPPHLSLEQCSSEATARYKAHALSECLHFHTFVDLTGGFGVDCAFIGQLFGHAVYVERSEALCRIAAHNFPLLGLHHIDVVNGDAIGYLEQMSAENPVDLIYIDPARRDGYGKKVISVAECEPNVAALQTLLLQKARHVLIKLSPMLDLTQALNVMTHTEQAYVVAAGNECKELLLLLGHASVLAEDVPILAEDVPVHCINLSYSSSVVPFTFTRREESIAACRYAAAPRAYLYEPHAALLKAGAFRTLACRYDVEKLAVNTHHYTSDRPIADFPGRCFRITGTCAVNRKALTALFGKEVARANLTVRNFPASVATLRRQLHLADGGATYLFAATLHDGRKVLIAGEKSEATR
jgi:16S rRNA G966 N2-methylase RsmD